MNFWEWADKNPGVLIIALVIVAMSIPSFQLRWRSAKGSKNASGKEEHNV